MMDGSNIVYIVVFTIAVGFLGYIFLGIWRRAPSASPEEPPQQPQIENVRLLLFSLVSLKKHRLNQSP
jgi:hypothetical protein